MAAQFNVNLCEGAILPKIVKFTLPLGISMLLQFAFHAADMAVVGRYVSANAMAAVGSTGALMGLCITLLTGLSVGTSVLTAQYYGARNWTSLRNILRTSIAVALSGGVIIAVFGFFLAETFLKWMKSPTEILGLSRLYLRIIFAGMPLQMSYVFGSSIMRALGDTKRPLFFLTVAGTANVLLNLFFVLVLKLGVAGVAIATVISNGISACFVLRVLCTYGQEFRLDLKKLHIYWDSLYRMARIGLPTSAQSSCFSLSNIIIQSSVNSLGAVVMAGNAAALQYENLLYLFSSYSLHLAAVSFTGQNYGGGYYKRIVRSILYCIMLGVVLGEVIGWGFYIPGRSLLSIFNSESDVIDAGHMRMFCLFLFYGLCGAMDVIQGACSGLGYAVVPAILMLLSVCVLRIGWVFTIFAKYHTMHSLLFSYPVSWLLAILLNGLFLLYILKKKIKPELKQRKLKKQGAQ